MFVESSIRIALTWSVMVASATAGTIFTNIPASGPSYQVDVASPLAARGRSKSFQAAR